MSFMTALVELVCDEAVVDEIEQVLDDDEDEEEEDDDEEYLDSVRLMGRGLADVFVVVM